MRRYLRILGLFIRTEVQREIEYRANLLMEVIQMLLVVGSSVGAVLVLFDYTTALNSWTLPQMLVLLGVYYLVQGVEEMVFQPSVTQLMEHVRLGTLDFTLLKPANSQFLLSLRQWNIVQVAQILLGATVLGYGVSQIGNTVSVESFIGFLITLACGLLLVYSVLLVLATLSFWFVRVDNILAVFWAFMDAGRFPVDVYPGWLRVTLSTVVPIGIAVTVPAEAIANRLDLLGFLAILGGTVFAWLFSSWFWRVGLRNYTGASA
jgi:ABC-2 type transport system permease protein